MHVTFTLMFRENRAASFFADGSARAAPRAPLRLAAAAAMGPAARNIASSMANIGVINHAFTFFLFPIHSLLECFRLGISAFSVFPSASLLNIHQGL